MTSANLEKIRTAFADIHPIPRQTHRRLFFKKHPVPGVALNNLYLETDEGIIDILSSVLGLGGFERLRERATTIPLYGRSVALISLEDLITAKKAVGREKDLLAVKELRAIAQKQGDDERSFEPDQPRG